MIFSEAYREGKIGRFEIMQFAEAFCNLNKTGKYIISLRDVEFDGENFFFTHPVPIKKKEVLLYFSLFMSGVQAVTDRRLASIFMNHYLACQNNTDFYKYLPKAHAKSFVMACGGFSGSGKSRVAREVAPEILTPFGAIVIRDDIVRKQLAAVSFETQLPEEYYSEAFETKVYKEMRRQAKQALVAGYPVIMDGLFYNQKERKLAESLAKRMNIPFAGFWMEAPLNVRVKRVRERLHNPSDVKTKEALRLQQEKDVGEITWSYILTDGDKDATIKKVLKILKKKV